MWIVVGSLSLEKLKQHTRSEILVHSLRQRIKEREAKARDKLAFSRFSDRVLELCSTTFSPMYARVFHKHWQNSFYGRMPRPYSFSDWENGVYEFYVPTFADSERNMKYHRIVVRTMPYLDKKIMMKESQGLAKPQGNTPNGIVDSETRFIVARELSPAGKRLWHEDAGRVKMGLKKLKQWFIKAFYSRQENLMVVPIICKVPEITVKRLLTLLCKFYDKRLHAFVGSWRQEGLYSVYGENTVYFIFNNKVVERGYQIVGNAVSCLYHSLNWIRQKLRQVKLELGRQSRIIEVLYRVKAIKPLLESVFAVNTPFSLGATPTELKPLISVLSGGG